MITTPMLNGSSHRDNHMPFFEPETLIVEYEETEEAGDQSQEGNKEAIKELKSCLETLESFYVFDKFLRTDEKVDRNFLRKIHNGIAKCQHPSCKGKKGFTYSTHTRSHLKQHYKNMHKDQLPQLSAAIEGLNKRSRAQSRESENSKKRQICLEESLWTKFNQERARQCYTRWFIETMTPLAVADHPSTRRMFYHVNPEFHPTSRRTMGRDIKKLIERGRTQVVNLLSQQKWVATTADSWTAHNRAFLGMTVHWIDRDTLKRCHATLVCKEVKESQMDQLLGKLITEIHQDFSIHGKVAATITDNGTNYAATFNTFGEANQEPEDPNPQVMDLQVRLRAQGDNPSLPPHHRCSAHTVNLLATTDVRDVQGSEWWRTTAKIQALWNLQNSSPVAANQIKAAFKRKLEIPVMTRWNSLYDCVVVLLEALSVGDQLDAINTILINHYQPNGVSPITEVDIRVLKEYKLVMQPVAQCLDMLQVEGKAYMGTLLPSIWLMKASLEEQSQNVNLLYARPLVQALLRGFEKRFGHLFEADKLLMATALHPNFTLKALETIAPEKVEKIKNMITRELRAIIEPREEQQQLGQPTMQEPQDLDARLFNKLFARGVANQQQDVREVLRKSMEEWVPSQGELAWSLFPCQHREMWVDLFIKYNTPLPSSASVERLFSMAGDVLRAKGSSLDEVSFEELVFLKGNIDLLEEMGQEDMDEEEDL